MNELLINLMTYSAIPVTAWWFYIRLYDRMEAKGVVEPPEVQFFFIFTVYAGWLMVFFILLSGAWSDLMYLVLVYLIFASPILMLGVTISLVPLCRLSRYHTGAIVASGIYLGMCALVVFMCVLAVLARI
jgi:hypothetical protein